MVKVGRGTTHPITTNLNAFMALTNQWLQLHKDCGTQLHHAVCSILLVDITWSKEPRYSRSGASSSLSLGEGPWEDCVNSSPSPDEPKTWSCDLSTCDLCWVLMTPLLWGVYQGEMMVSTGGACQLVLEKPSLSKCQHNKGDGGGPPQNRAPMSRQGFDIEEVKTHKYLGNHLNSKLEWTHNWFPS